MAAMKQKLLFFRRVLLAVPVVCLILTAGGCTKKNAGSEVFKKKCASCHGLDGKAQTKLAQGRPFADLTDGKWSHGSDRESVFKLVADGDPKSPMPPFRERLSPEELNAVVDHVMKLAQGTVPPQK